MAKKELPLIRKRFRRGLYALAILSFAFFACMVTLRMNRSAHWYVAKNYGENIFALDIIKSQAMAHWQDDEQKYKTANRLIGNGIFSKQYGLAGVSMMKDLADSGHAPSQTIYADVLMGKPNEQNRLKARYYYHLAAINDYAPALERLKTPY